MNSIKPFNFHDHPVRVVMRDGEPWFVAADICAALELANVTMALRRLDADEQALISIEGISRGNDQASVINESGMHSLVLSSRKPEAKKFKKWVTSEVLPSIRKTGKFEAKATAGPLTLEMREKLKTMVVQKLDAMQYTAAIGLLAKMQVNWELMDDEPAHEEYHFPLKSADPHGRWCQNGWLSPRALMDPKNRAPELELIAELEKNGHDVTGAKMRILAMRQNMAQVEDTKETLRQVKSKIGAALEACTVGLIERGKNVKFIGKPNPLDPEERRVFADQL